MFPVKGIIIYPLNNSTCYFINSEIAHVIFSSHTIEYIVAGSNEELPLGEEFQKLLRCFIDLHEKKPAKRFARAAILLEQMAYVFFSISPCIHF